LLDAAGNPTGVTTTTSTAPGQVGYYEFKDLAPGTYGVHEIQPSGWLDGKDTPGDHGGVAASEAAGIVDRITGTVLVFGDHAINYNFGELLPGSIAGQVQAHGAGDCDFDNPQMVLSGVTIQLLNANGTVVATTTTDENGRYHFDNLRPAQYAVHEVQPSGYFSDDTRVGTVGGDTDDADNFTHINLPSGVNAIHYDFCEQTPSSIAGQVQAHATGECNFQDPEMVLSGVTIQLFDGNGHLIATTTTDVDGRYKFTGLPLGEYTVHEIQPAGYFSDDDNIGSVGGQSDDSDTISHINLPGGTDATDYDFCEQTPSSIAGQVQAHTTAECNFADPEIVLPGVTIQLIDSSGHLIATAVTDADGRYQFTGLREGQYTVHEIQPAGYFSDDDNIGSVGGQSDDPDTISHVNLPGGTDATDYDFCEVLPGSIRGQVLSSPDGNCDDGIGETPIAGVQIDLLNEQGQVVAITRTDQDGNYLFDGLRPGTYGVQEHQPTGYFEMDDHVGDGGGDIEDIDTLVDIYVGSDKHWVGYDFCESPPASLSGYVFIDGGPIITNLILTPDDVADVKDGLRTPDDQPLAGVVLQLLDGNTGAPILGENALPGAYPDGPITTVTDANGYYHFDNLPAGSYAVVELQPGGLIDGIDHDGTTGGTAINPLGHGGGLPVIPPPLGGVPGPGEFFQQQFGNDVIFQIPLAAGQSSLENNFSEVFTKPPITHLPPGPPLLLPAPPIPPPPLVVGPQLAYMPPPFFLIPGPWDPQPGLYAGSVGAGDYTWHLSVVDAGQPRSTRFDGSVYQLTSTQIDVTAAQNVSLDSARWTLATVTNGNVTILRNADFGRPDAIPIVGDWNGDGITEIGVFVDGNWYLDLNDDGRWDQGDLWAKLGSRDDLPVTGDWDGDGKTDIGIFGPAWPRDPWAIAHEPGIPDADNWPTWIPGKMKNVPPTADEATSGGRVMKRAGQAKSRTDLIDHVFYYGAPGDVPVTGDWNGDGIRTIGTFRDGHWVLDTDGDGRLTIKDASFEFGQKGDLPVVGDFDGDGVDEIGVYRDGKWIIDTNHNHQIDAQDMVFELGGYGDKPVVGDWNGDGKTDPGTYQPGVAQDRVSRRAG
jgi:protocatechuate 3,4-dioxygenase beta subunit